MKKVFIGSAYRGDTEQNLHKAKIYCSKAVDEGYLPIAPHLYFPQFLDDENESEREKGIDMGIDLMRTCATEVWFFGDFTEGMLKELAVAKELLLPIRYFDARGKERERSYED